MINKTLIFTTLSLIAANVSAYELRAIKDNQSTAKAVEIRPAKVVATYKAPAKQEVSLLSRNKDKKPMEILASLDRTKDSSRCIFTVDRALTFYDILDRAMCHDPNVREKWLQLKNYKIEYDESFSDYLPRVSYQVGYSRGSEKQITEYDPIDYRQESRSTGLTQNLAFEWLLFDFGRREAKVSKAKNEYIMYKMLVRSDLQDLLLQVAQRYFNVMAAKASLNAIIKNEEIAKRSYETSRAKRQGGVGVLADELQANSYVISSEYQRHQAEGKLKQAMGELALLIGLPMDKNIPFATSEFDVPSAFSMENIDQLLAKALEQHPKILLAKQQILASQDMVNMSKRSFLPQVSLSGSVSRNDPKSSSFTDYRGTTNDITKSSSSSIGVNVKIPIFNSLTSYNQLRQAMNQLNLAENQHERFEKEVSLSVWNAYRQLETATRNAVTVAKLLQNAQESHRIAEGRYKSGIGNILELLNTQNDLSSAEINNVEVKVQWHAARLALAASLGMLELDAIKESTLN